MSEQIRSAVLDALREVAEFLPPGTAFGQEADAPLLEIDGGPLDSLGVVNLMVALEGRVEGVAGHPISFADSLAHPPEESPYRTAETLTTYVREMLDGADGS